MIAFVLLECKALHGTTFDTDIRRIPHTTGRSRRHRTSYEAKCLYYCQISFTCKLHESRKYRQKLAGSTFHAARVCMPPFSVLARSGGHASFWRVPSPRTLPGAGEGAKPRRSRWAKHACILKFNPTQFCKDRCGVSGSSGKLCLDHNSARQIFHPASIIPESPRLDPLPWHRLFYSALVFQNI